MVIKKEYLVVLNSRNRVQQTLLQLNQNPFTKDYTIERSTCQFGGKEIQQPTLTISCGKAGRTTAEQAMLQYNSLLKNYLDKGYVKVSSLTNDDYLTLKEEDIINALGGGFISDQKGIPKPMLAKSADKCAASIWDKELYASKKIDGTRCLMYYRDGLVQTASRGGHNYNAATKHIRENPIIKELFKQNPALILDGELYKHGSDWPLQRISGLTRLKEWTEECGELEYWIYDYVSSQPFKERLEILNEMRTLFPENSHIKICEHVLVSNYTDAKTLHDKWVEEGFEGLCARNPEKEYGVNKRSALYLIKMKNFTDAEFLITGVKEGLREEDMCFVLQTADGKEFSAKPIGTAEQRRYYLTHPEEFVGKMGTCKYFYYSKDGIPQLPVFKCVREPGE
jgi:DNA ligase-1